MFSSSHSQSLWLVVAVLWSQSAIWAAPDAVSNPKAGSKVRKAILDALRKPVAAMTGKKVIFTNVKLNVSRSFAYVSASSVDERGRAVGPVEATNGLQAVLTKQSAAWRVRDWSYATEGISLDWEKKYPRAPKKLWPQNR